VHQQQGETGQECSGLAAAQRLDLLDQVAEIEGDLQGDLGTLAREPAQGLDLALAPGGEVGVVELVQRRQHDGIVARAMPAV
jgi:hypothetical protein